MGLHSPPIYIVSDPFDLAGGRQHGERLRLVVLSTQIGALLEQQLERFGLLPVSWTPRLGVS